MTTNLNQITKHRAQLKCTKQNIYQESNKMEQQCLKYKWQKHKQKNVLRISNGNTTDGNNVN